MVMTMKTIKTFSELKKLKTFNERYHYLKLDGEVGAKTFGNDRYLNQKFYKSREWQSIRNFVIARDNGCDLGIDGYDIFDKILIHHMNPITPDDIVNKNQIILDPEYLICVSEITHNAIHYGDEQLLPEQIIFRKPNDTTLW